MRDGPIRERPKPFSARSRNPTDSCGISPCFQRLSPTLGHVIHLVLTSSPLYSGTEVPFRARLACLIHAASVHSEPGSNSPIKFWAGLPKEPALNFWRIRPLNLLSDPTCRPVRRNFQKKLITGDPITLLRTLRFCSAVKEQGRWGRAASNLFS